MRKFVAVHTVHDITYEKLMPEYLKQKPMCQ